jgi:hypothetical protein
MSTDQYGEAFRLGRTRQASHPQDSSAKRARCACRSPTERRLLPPFIRPRCSALGTRSAAQSSIGGCWRNAAGPSPRCSARGAMI